MDQVKAIIGGTASEITVQDSYGKPVTVKTPVNRLVTLDWMIVGSAQIIGIGDKIVGIDENTVNRGSSFPRSVR